MPTGFTTVSAAHLQDATGTTITNATISFLPVGNNGAPLSFRTGGTAGQTIAQAVTVPVVNGAFSIQLADTALTTPANVGYRVTVVDNAGHVLLAAGYTCIQPTGSTWSLDTYTPNAAPQAIVQLGPTGKSAYDLAVANGFEGSESAWLASLQGTSGPPGASGSTLPIYATTAAGVAAGTGVVAGGNFLVPATNPDYEYLIYVNNAGVAQQVGIIPAKQTMSSTKPLAILDSGGFALVVVDETLKMPIVEPRLVALEAGGITNAKFTPSATELAVVDKSGFVIDVGGQVSNLQSQVAVLQSQAGVAIVRPEVGPIAGTLAYQVSPGPSQYDIYQGFLPIFPAADCSDLQIVVPNTSGVGEAYIGPDHNAKFTLEYPAGVFSQFSFNGGLYANVEQTAVAVSDVLAVDIPKGAVAYLHFRYVRKPGQTLPFGQGHFFAALHADSISGHTPTYNGGVSWDTIEAYRTRTLTDFVFTAGSHTATSASGAFEQWEFLGTLTDPNNILGLPNNTTRYSWVSANTITLVDAPTSTHSAATATITATDKTGGGIPYYFISSPNFFGQTVGPTVLAIVGKSKNPPSRFYINGDSITFGTGGSSFRSSWAVAGLTYAIATQTQPDDGSHNSVALNPAYPYVQTAQPSERLQFVVGGAHTTRLRAAYGCDYSLGLWGTNDIAGSRTAYQIQSDLVTYGRMMTSRGVKMINATIPPRSSSTDGFMTLTNQTTDGSEAVRQSVMTWQRAGCPVDPSSLLPVAVGTTGALLCKVFSASGTLLVNSVGVHPIAAILDLAAIYDPGNIGKWRVDVVGSYAAPYTGDGIHPTNAGHMIGASVVNAFLPSLSTL